MKPRAFSESVWLVQRRGQWLILIVAIMASLSALLINVSVPLLLSVSSASVPLIVYLPVMACFVAGVQLSYRLEPNETLSVRPIRRLDAGLLVTFTLIFVGAMLLVYYFDEQPRALLAGRNFILGLWSSAAICTLIGVKRGCLATVLGFIAIVHLTPRAARDESSWVALTEAPIENSLTLAVVALIVVTSAIIVLFGDQFASVLD